MKKTKLLLTLLCLGVGIIPALAQSVTITREMQQVQMASVLAMYKNEFGSFEKPDMSDTFPFAVIRMHLEGNAHDVKAAKERLTLYMGQQTGVESRVTTYSNQILFLVRSRRPMIFIDCGDGCEQVLLSNMQKLKSNCLYDCTVRFRVEKESDSSNELSEYDFLLEVTPTDAIVEVVVNGEKQVWALDSGRVEKKLQEGSYFYSIVAEDYATQEGTFNVSSTETFRKIDLRPAFGYLTINGTAEDMASITHQETRNVIAIESLPISDLQCDTGVYVLEIDRDKYYYRDTITISSGEQLTVSPIDFQKKKPRINTFVVAEAGYAFAPQWGFGGMLGQMYNGLGWYVKGRSNFQFGHHATNGLVCEQGGLINGELPFYSGRTAAKEWLFNAGFVVDFLGKKRMQYKNNMIGLYVGAGYGMRELLWEKSNGDWVKYNPTSASGVSAGAGVIGSVAGVTLTAGVNTIQFKYLEIEFGIGYTF
ncbi:MAG: hypothetical protein J6C48_05370 [Paludibacteraceae bacterium]|nr:hypothetical protein [Paludibacteraceae bacterium]